MAVRIRMKMMGRKHRHYFRIVAIDHHQPRDGRVIEELGSYDPQVRDTDARVKLLPDRIKYWLSVGAQPSDKVSVLIKKYGAEGTHLEAQRLALARLAQGKRLPVPRPKSHTARPAEAPAEGVETLESIEVVDADAEAPAEPPAE